jgi:hypothetical protein
VTVHRRAGGFSYSGRLLITRHLLTTVAAEATGAGNQRA